MTDICAVLGSDSLLYILLESPRDHARSLLRISENRKLDGPSIFENVQDAQQNFSDILQVFQAETLKIRELKMVFDGNPKDFFEFLANENSKMQVTGKRLKINVEKLIVTSSETPESHFLKFLKLFKPESMKKLEINFPSIDSELVDKICKLEFFEKLKTFELGPKVENSKIEKLLSARKMKCRVGRLTAKDIAVVTEAYLTKNLGAYFKIFTDRPIELNELFRVINFMPWPMPITIT
ncbi:Protein CBG05600 [Caenorhabditis briggsae]|uniref:Protein CBG05600 n=1 Tax=Caenorhabditis briggsae TaxID=6238 RepID=A8X088_CAEBR|nr:Protein CBG05600 [Caenorhabditis briggsae]CAP26048.2 Protein CBG05600 [Caenorhabditis briggsae]